MQLLFYIMGFVYGIYTIYAAIMAKRSQKLNHWFLGKEQKTIRNEKGYINFIYGRTIVMGATVLLFMIVQIIHMHVVEISQIRDAILLLFFTVCIWFYASISRGKQKFW